MQIEAHQCQLQQQERFIRLLEEEVHSLKKANKQLGQQLDSVLVQRNHYKGLVYKDPLFMILQGADKVPEQSIIYPEYNEVERRLNLYRTKAGSLQRKVHELERSLMERENQIKETERKLLAYEQKERDSRREYRLLQQQNNALIQNHQQLLNAIQSYESKWKILEKQIHQTKKYMLENTLEQKEQLKAYDQKLQSLRNSWLRAWRLVVNEEEWRRDSDSERVQELSDKFKKQSQIMEEMGRELDARNDHVAQILKNQNQVSQKSTFQSDQHSVREMMHSSKLRQQRFKELLQKYREIQHSLQQSLKEKKQLQKQYTLLKQQVESTKHLTEANKNMKNDLQKAKMQSESANRYAKQLIPTLQALLAENDVFQNFMRQQYGNKVYQSKIEEETQMYLMRKKERDSKEVWANTAELIEMNKKLRDKLTKRH